MKIKEIRAVNVDFPRTEPKTKGRRPGWNTRAPRALPINKYPEFPRISEAVKIYTIAEAAGIATIPHMGGGSPFGQHFGLAMPESPMAEYWIGTDPGIPLEEVCPIPGMATPKDGYVVPSDAPGFGMEIDEKWIELWHHTPG